MMCDCPACNVECICVFVVIKCPVPPCASYLLSPDEVIYLRMAFGTTIVSSFTNTMSKELMYDSFLSST